MRMNEKSKFLYGVKDQLDSISFSEWKHEMKVEASISHIENGSDYDLQSVKKRSNYY